MKVILAGAGAFGQKHLDGIKEIDGAECVAIVGRRLEPTKEIAKKYGVETVTTGFFRPEYFYTYGFRIEKRYAGLVKDLTEESS